MKFMHASKELLESHYCDLSKKPFFPELIRYMSSGPVVPMVWEGVNVVKTGRMMLGETNPKDSAPGTIRGDFCIDVGRNICHGSDSIESAKKEIGMWFMPHEVPHWRSHATQWVYENEEIETSASAEVLQTLRYQHCAVLPIDIIPSNPYTLSVFVSCCFLLF